MTLISRENAIERIANDNVVGGMKRINEYRDSTEHNDYLDGISTAIATVDDLPSADAVQGCDGCRYNTRIPQKQCLCCKRYWRDGYERKGGDQE